MAGRKLDKLINIAEQNNDFSRICVIEKLRIVSLLRMLMRHGDEKKHSKGGRARAGRGFGGRRRKTVARNIDYGEIRFFLLHKFESEGVRSGKQQSSLQENRRDIINAPPQIMFINTFLLPLLSDSSLRAFAVR